MGIVHVNKELNIDRIGCSGSFDVTLSLTAEPDVISHPKDIVLVLDRSYSMSGDPLRALKQGVNHFIDAFADATDPQKTGQLGCGNRIGIVSFCDTAFPNTQLTTATASLKSAVNSLRAGGTTNHEAAFTAALKLFDPAGTNDKVMIMFTDGISDTGKEGFAVAESIKAQGITLYAIGYGDLGKAAQTTIRRWVSEPVATHALFISDLPAIETVFDELVRNIELNGSTGAKVSEVVSDCFRIVSVGETTLGQAQITGRTTLEWDIGDFGLTAPETASCTFTVVHTGACTGTAAVNESIVYTDNETNIVTFPSPTVEITCDTPSVVEDCPRPCDIDITGCSDYVDYDASDITMEGLGRVLQLSVTLRDICPNKRVALAAVIAEVDDLGNEHPRGLKTMMIPAHAGPACRDVAVRCIKFVLPEDLDVTGTAGSLCNTRKIRARFMANYVDSDYYCCEGGAPID